MTSSRRSPLFFFLVLLLARPAWATVKDVPVAQRDAIVVIELSNNASSSRKEFFRTIERYAARESAKLLQSYRKVAILTGEGASFQSFLKKLAEFSGNLETKAVDIFLHVHGLPGGIFFRDGEKAMADVRTAILESASTKGKLRAVYSTACHGRTHAAEWLAAGFRTASGATKVNTNAAYELPVFTSNWIQGHTFAVALDKGDDPKWRKFYDDLASRLGFDGADSLKELHGEKGLTISSP